MSRPKTISDEALLKIARECFFEKGPTVPTRVIAEKAGISQPALFKRFKNKEQLFLAAVSSPDAVAKVVELKRWIITHPTEKMFRPQLEELLFKLWSLLQDILPRVIAIHAHGTYLSPEKLFEGIKKPPAVKMLENIVDFIIRGQKNGQIDKNINPEITAMNILGPLQGRLLFKQFFKYKIDCDELSDRNYIKQTSDTLYKGLISASELKRELKQELNNDRI